MKPFRGFYWSPSGEHLAEDWAALQATGANGAVLPHHAVTAELLEQLAAKDITVTVDLALFAGAALREAFPDSAPITEHGRAMGADDWYVPICPNHEGVRAHHIHDLSELLEDHGQGLDGIWLDFIRYPMRWEVAQPKLVQSCFCDCCLGGFLGEPGRVYTATERRTATETILAEQGDTWVDWKCRRIAGFVEEIAGLIRSARPHLRLGLFALPWRLTDYGGAIRTIVSQDIALLGDIVDVISPMAYHRLCRQRIPWIADVVSDAWARSRAQVLPVIQSLDLPEPLSAGELAEAIDARLGASDQGVMVFDLRSVARSPAKVAVVREVFRAG